MKLYTNLKLFEEQILQKDVEVDYMDVKFDAMNSIRCAIAIDKEAYLLDIVEIMDTLYYTIYNDNIQILYERENLNSNLKFKDVALLNEKCDFYGEVDKASKYFKKINKACINHKFEYLDKETIEYLNSISNDENAKKKMLNEKYESIKKIGIYLPTDKS